MTIFGPDDALLYESSRTRVVRRPVVDPKTVSGQVIWKEPLGPQAADRLRHEVGILTVLAAVPGVAHLVPMPGAANGFAVEDVGGVSLASMLKGPAGLRRGVETGLDVAHLVAFGLALARVLTGVHQAGVVHKDINPTNILVLGPDRPVLIDWDLATTFAEERPGFTHESTIEGTLAYLAPEQSGRTGRGVDQRADLYAVGATLYEVAVGRPPFGSGDGDALTLIHDHLARVPLTPNAVNPVVPVALSDIIGRLLEKEPDRRYQSAEGLAHDLARVLDPEVTQFVLGERDFPVRIGAPSRLVGRESEIAALGAALDLAVAGHGRGVLVTGAPGVGKSSLIDELRSMVTARNGRFIQGKFDQYRQDESTDAVAQAIRALARLLLAEPEDELAEIRTRIMDSIGPDADVLAIVQPEFSVLLGVAPASLAGADAQQLGARLFRAGLGVLRALSSPERPLVMVIDDLQWGANFPISFLDAVLMDDSLSGLLLVGAYRDAEVDDAHPLSAMLTRWERLGATPTSLRLANLPPAHLGTLLAQMLRLPADRAVDLATAINDRTKGNPFDTVELVNALRREGVLRVGDAGWEWDAATIRTFIGHGDVVDLLTTRIDALPPDAASLLEILACLGGDVDLDLLAIAAGLDSTALTELLTPSLEDGLLVMIHDREPAVRFRHDRVQQAASGRLEPHPRQRLHLRLARRLVVHPHLEGAAAELYLDSAPAAIEEPERRPVAELFRAAAAHTRLINQAQSERFLAAALALLDPAGPADAELVTQLLVERHAALFTLARLAEVDELYAQLAERIPDPVQLAIPASVQLTSLSTQNRSLEAVMLCTDLMTRLGFPPPAEADLFAEIGAGMDRLYRWVGEGPQPDELTRPEPSDPRVLAAVRLMERALPAAFVCHHPIMPWLILQAHRFWIEHGPCATLVASLGGLPILGIVMRQDFAVGYQAVHRFLRVSEAHGYEPATTQLRSVLAVFTTPWFESIEESVALAQGAREGLLRYGDLQFTAFTYLTALTAMFECAPSLAAGVAEYAAATVFWTRTGDETVSASFGSHRQLLASLRGEIEVPGDFNDDTFDEESYPLENSAHPLAVFYFHFHKAIAMAVFGDLRQLAVHTAEAIQFLPNITGMYVTAVFQLLRGLVLAEQIRSADPAERAVILEEFATGRDWLAARSADAPMNFSHLVRWLDAERAWATGNFQDAATEFDGAITEVGHRRPWHAAIITERAARFHLAHGLDHLGRILLAEARGHYERWGASAKVAELEREFPYLTGSAGIPLTPAVGGSVHTVVTSSEAIDLMAVLRASQVLSSETNLEQLRARVVDVLTAMTGATAVQLLLWNELDEADPQETICLAALRYAERTLEPLLVTDATRDDRFSRDRYLEGLESCSLLVVPVLSRGVPRAMLLMENRLSHGNFTAGRLDAVVLIAGQLAVCLDNALAERFRSLVQRSSELTLVCDRSGVLSYASSASIDILALPDTLLVGRPITDLVHLDDRDAFTSWLSHEGVQGQMLECRLLPADARLRWVEVSCTDLSSDPAVAALVLHLRDVTDRHHLESELRHAQKLESVGQLAAGVAHEINTPIQFIADNLRFIAESLTPLTGLLDGYRDALTDSGAGADLAAVQQALISREQAMDLEFLRVEIPQAAGQALEGTQRVARIVRAMKAFAHPGGDGKSLCDLNEAIRNTLIVADSEIHPVADLVLDLAVLPPVLCNLGDINQAILNLVINAAHAITDAAAAGRGRGTLTVRTRADTANDIVVVEIQDTGTGIPDQIADRVFDQFFTTKAVGVGTGQGLSLVHTLIHDRHHGTITFTTEPGVGTTFTIRLPNAAPTPTPTPADPIRAAFP